ncbi:BTAD domain-containing putative transcriptional regulator [Streptosporangium sp. NPDC050280]|uniref:BTAD domain-containing putative transcriptional regulator n=1 Tax=unclassified Streptosporangium TaxID=2632669 RepID=UPI00342B407D
MRVGILGPLEVAAAGESVEIGGVRLRVLLIRLALGAGRVVTADELSDALWPQEQPADRANAVRSLVARLRRSLPDASVLRSDRGGYRLELPPDAVDAHRFERLARAGRRALNGGDAQAAGSLLGEALALWRGPALADAAGASFATAYAAGLEEARLAAIEDRAEADLASGRHAHLVAELSEAATRHPLRERLQGLLLRALHAQGRQAEALAGYERIRLRLAEELGADPGPELREIHLALLQEGRAEPARPQKGNLRTALTSFVGRTAEVRRVGASLAEGRLVTLVGPGGAGKTRLATTVAGELAERWPGGAWLVELAAVTDTADVPQAVFGALGTRVLDPQGAPRGTTSRLVEALSRAETLIVLDNCEHLVEAVAHLAEDLLGRCPGLRVLATSREPLGILGEVLCPVAPLALPEPDASVRQAVTSPAVRLLAERAAAVRPGFAVTEENVAAVVEICRRLDGLPLAIELAAARMRSLTAPQVAERLGDRFRLLTGGSRTALPRHRTLRAVVDWSWDLLGDERRFAERLAVFPGGISVEAAERVCAEPGTALDLLGALVDRSLLQVVEAPQPRYRMLETIREYGLERLAENGEIARVRAAHAAYFLDLAETAEPFLREERQLVWLAVLETEHDNLLAALHFAADAGDADTAVRLAAALSTFWMMRENHAEAVVRLRLALDVPGEVSSERRSVATAFHLINRMLSGEHEGVEDVVERFGALAGAVAPDTEDPFLALIEPILAIFTDDVVRGVAAVERQMSHPHPWTRAMLFMIRSALLENEGDQVGRRRDLLAAAAGFRGLGDRWGLAQVLSSLAEAHLVFGDFDEAVETMEEAIRLLGELNPDDHAVHQRITLAGARAQQGDVDRARAELLAMTRPGERRWSQRNVAFAHLALGDLDRRAGDLDGAERHYEAAATGIEEIGFVAPQFRALILRAMAHLAVDRGDLVAAERWVTEATDWAVEGKDMPVLAHVGVAAAALRAHEGDLAGAAETLGVAERLRGAPDRFNLEIAGLIRRLRDELGDAAYDAAHARGMALDRAAALDQVRRR